MTIRMPDPLARGSPRVLRGGHDGRRQTLLRPRCRQTSSQNAPTPT